MSREVTVAKGKAIAIVDDADYPLVSGVTWYLYAGKYAAHPTLGYMHRFLLGLKKGDGALVDHINRDPMDNRRENLRVCNRLQNNANRGSNVARGDLPKGVRKAKGKSGGWNAYINIHGKQHYLGAFNTLAEAAAAYNGAAAVVFGEFAYFNERPAPELDDSPRDVAPHPQPRALGKSSKYRGVTWDTWTKSWSAKLTHNGKTLIRKRFKTEEEAARACDEASIRAFGDRAILNFPAAGDTAPHFPVYLRKTGT